MAEKINWARFLVRFQVRDFLEHGIIRNSVNFPETELPYRGVEGTVSKLLLLLLSILSSPFRLESIAACARL